MSAGYLGQQSNIIYGNSASANASHRSSLASFKQTQLQGQTPSSSTIINQAVLNSSTEANRTGSIIDSENIKTNESDTTQRERAYIEKIKLLKSENKKLIALLRDSEKLFYQKLKETKKESENLSALFKQLWPLIKNKVKDPNGLLKTVNGLQGDAHEF